MPEFREALVTSPPPDEQPNGKKRRKYDKEARGVREPCRHVSHEGFHSFGAEDLEKVVRRKSILSSRYPWAPFHASAVGAQGPERGRMGLLDTLAIFQASLRRP